MSASSTYATIMTAERLLVGAAAMAAPGALLTGFGAPTELDTPAVRYTTRLFGVRNIAMGLQVWSARDDPARLRSLAGQNAVVELTDLVAGAAVTASDERMRTSGIAVMVTSLAVASGFLGLRALASRAT
jgi:hypothetical protein